MKNKIVPVVLILLLFFTNSSYITENSKVCKIRDSILSSNRDSILQLGMFFDKKQYIPVALPVFSDTKSNLPEPIFDENPKYIECYWKAWSLAFKQFRQPQKSSNLVSNYIDEAFNEGLFLWDTSFMTMFCNYGHPYVPGIQSLDNFYCTQMKDGEIVREISEITGQPRVQYAKPGTPASLNHPILAWAEVESYKMTNDKKRLKMVYPALAAYFKSYVKILDEKSGLYLGTWASMDNSPRIPGMLCSIDTSSEVVLFARNLAFIAKILGLNKESDSYEMKADQLTKIINDKLWNTNSKFYYDLNFNHEIHNVRTIAAYWTLIAHIADKDRAAKLVEYLGDTSKFARLHMVPTLPADEKGYEPTGHYWRGGVWTPTDIMIVKGLEEYGYDDLAEKIAVNHVDNVFKVYEKTGTIWEFYQPDHIGVGIQPGHNTRPDFAGWTANAPIKFFIEYKLGIHVNAPENNIIWKITSTDRVGIKKLWFGGNTVDLICERANSEGQRIVSIKAEKSFRLILKQGQKSLVKNIHKGNSNFTI